MTKSIFDSLDHLRHPMEHAHGPWCNLRYWDAPVESEVGDGGKRGLEEMMFHDVEHRLEVNSTIRRTMSKNDITNY
jgi:hypothetical protein